MSFIRSTFRIAKIGTLLSLVSTLFLISNAAAQDRTCECVDSYDTVAVRTVPVRRVAKPHKAKRSYGTAAYRTARVRTVVQPVYRTVYVPVREVEYVPRYVEDFDDNDCDDFDRTASRVVVTKQVYSDGYNGRNVYYNNGGTRLYTNGHVNTSSYFNGNYGGRAVDPDYYDTQRIARDYGFKDGYYDGRQAGMERDAYHPENSGDYQKATNGYEDTFGDKDVYRQSYREAYLRGYDSGWRSVAQSRTHRSARW